MFKVIFYLFLILNCQELLASFTSLELHANIETIGVIVHGNNLPQDAELSYRKTGTATWKAGHPLTLIDGNRLASSLFELAPNTTYEIKVVNGADQITGTATTKIDLLTFTPSTVIHVDGAASPGGNGTSAAPFKTIQAGVDAAMPGTQVLVENGLYQEQVNISQSGVQDNWLQIKANGSEVILDGAEEFSGNIWTDHSTAGVWYHHTNFNDTRLYMSKKNVGQVYKYPSLDKLLAGLGTADVPMAEGWFFDAPNGDLYVRSLTDPKEDIWQLAQKNYGFYASEKNWVWIEGFIIQHFGATDPGRGIEFNNCSNIMISKNTLINNLQGIEISWNGTAAQGNNTRIEQNEISDAPVDTWPWNAVKYSTAETSAIILDAHEGVIVRDNQLHESFNGIYAGRWGDLENQELNIDIDVYDNNIHHIGDDGLEPEGTCTNNRFRNNTFDIGLVPISIAPITVGPVWVMRNVSSNYNGTGLKFGIAGYNPDGRIYIYHNTFWADQLQIGNVTEDLAAVTYYEQSDNVVLRNNSFRGTWYAMRHKVPENLVNHDWDYDNWYTTQDEDYFIMHDDIIYQTASAFYTATGLEQHGITSAPLHVNALGGDFHLQAGSPNIDAGIDLPGINDSYAGTSPDLGAFEYETALAIEDISLNLRLNHAAKSIQLKWTSATPPENIISFTVQRSMNAEKWAAISSLQVAATKTQFDFEDRAPLLKTNYYRIKETTLSGKTNYSNVESIAFGGSINDIKIFPNPAQKWISIETKSHVDEITIQNTSGKILRLVTYTAGQKLDMSFLKNGTFYLHCFEKGKGVGFGKLVIVRD